MLSFEYVLIVTLFRVMISPCAPPAVWQADQSVSNNCSLQPFLGQRMNFMSRPSPGFQASLADYYRGITSEKNKGLERCCGAHHLSKWKLSLLQEIQPCSLKYLWLLVQRTSQAHYYNFVVHFLEHQPPSVALM